MPVSSTSERRSSSSRESDGSSTPSSSVTSSGWSVMPATTFLVTPPRPPSVVTGDALLSTDMGAVGAVGLVLHPRRDSQFAVDTEEQLARRSTLVVSLGGDGTVLRALRLCRSAPGVAPVPVLGVNLGRLGFLAEVDVPELPDALTAIDEHRFRVERRAAVQAVLPDGRVVIAFND